MFDALVHELSERYGLGDRGRDLFGLLVAYIHNDRRGGFGGFVEGFREQGHGELAASWFGNAHAGGLNASDVGTVFGQGLLNDWGTRLGASRATVAAAIAGVLPRLVAELTPGGRLPGGFATPASMGVIAPGGSASARRDEGSTSSRDASDFRVVPGVDGLVASRQAALTEVEAADAGPIVPGMELRDELGAVPPPASPVSESLRREPASSPAAGAVRSPADARREQEASANAIDPGERRIAEMAAALDPGETRRAPPPMHADRRPDGWRSAVHPPRPRRSGRAWWLLLFVLLAAAALAFAWWQGLLAPWLQPLIEQYRLPLQAQPSTA